MAHLPTLKTTLPLIVTANTYIEAAMEDELLTEPQDSAATKWTAMAPIQANPFVSLEIMQSGTLGKEIGAIKNEKGEVGNSKHERCWNRNSLQHHI